MRMKAHGCLSVWCLSACEYSALTVMNGVRSSFRNVPVVYVSECLVYALVFKCFR